MGYKSKIIKRDKKIAKEGDPAEALEYEPPLPNIIPKKSPSSPPEAPRPVLVAPVKVPPPSRPGNDTLLSLALFYHQRLINILEET